MKKSIAPGIVKGAICLLVASGLIMLSGKFSNYMLIVIDNALIYFICALGLSLLLGMSGQMSFASTMFMGLAGFITSLLSKNYQMDTILAAMISIALTAIFAYVVGLALVKLRGSYFAFATIGLAQIGSNLFLNWKWLSGGSDGRLGVPGLKVFGKEISNYREWLIVLLVVAILAAMVVERIRKTTLGRSAASVRDNIIVAETMGVNVYRTKLTCFVLASVLFATAGVLSVYMNHYAVESLFSYSLSVNYVLMVMLGGVNSIVGALLGSFIVTFLPEVFRPLEAYLRLIYGVMIILLMVFMPTGIVGLMALLWKRFKRKLKTGKIEKEAKKHV